MGDFNLSHRNAEDQTKIVELCQEKRINALNEITRSMSNNQLEYIFIDENMEEEYFVTSYNNFISDHKSIVARVGSIGNKLTQEIKERISFAQELHLKSKNASESQCKPNVDQTENPSQKYNKNQNKEKVKKVRNNNTQANINNTFTRRFENPDLSTCWLNACLQLILTAIDYDEDTIRMTFDSELGQELIKLQSSSKNKSLDPSTVKEIIATSEDTRVAVRLSELSYQIIDQNQVENQSRQIENLRFDLRRGQQCVRDFFLCLDQNLVCWPDVYSTFSFQLTHSTECSSCKHKNQFETTQLYLEMPVPPNDANLKHHVEHFLNEGSKVGSYCDEACKAFSEKDKRTILTRADEAKFFLVLLTRGIETLDGFHLVKNKIKSTENIDIR